MAVQVKMPQLSDTMHSGKIVSWNKKEGDSIKRGDTLAEVETDKANLEIESFDEGTLLKIIVPANEEAKVGEIIAVIGKAGEAVEGAPAKEAPKAEAPKAQPAPAAQKSAPAQAAAKEPSHAAPQNLKVVEGGAHEHGDANGRVKASPLAKRIASQHGVDLQGIRGSGPEGRILRRDVEGAVDRGQENGSAYQSEEQSEAAQAQAPEAAQDRRAEAPAARSTREPAAPAAAASGGTGVSKPLSKMRATIARRMEDAIQAPHFYVTSSINMRQALAFREAIKEDAELKSITINHLIVKAAAFALKREPRVNATFRNGELFEPSEINIGIVTSLDDGLLIPVVREADKLSLKDLAFEVKAAVERAKAGRPTSADLSGGTFSISNMGMFDVESFTAIINPGQGAILAVSAVKDVPVVENNQIVPGKMMKVTLSVDHRIIDGVVGARFLQHFGRALANPAILLLS